jgi:adenine/guanine/hypoxanthine permease
MTMGYILVVNPIILSNAIFLDKQGDLFSQLAVATAIASAVGSLCMGLFANYPFGLAPGMGTNAFFAFSVVIGLKIDWRLALSCIFVQGLIFIALTFTNVRRLLIQTIPNTIKHSTAAGIGLFIAYIGLSGDPATGGAGLIVANEATKTAFGSLTQPATLMAVAGLIITSAFVVRRVRGALLLGIFATAVLAWILGITAPPQSIFALPQLPVDLFGHAITGLSGLNASNIIDWLAVLFVFLFVDVFDVVGTLTGVGMRAGYIGEDGELPRANQALMADAVATTVGPIFGTSSVTPYVESISGVLEGGRTGFTAVIIGLLFILSLFFIPIFSRVTRRINRRKTTNASYKAAIIWIIANSAYWFYKSKLASRRSHFTQKFWTWGNYAYFRFWKQNITGDRISQPQSKENNRSKNCSIRKSNLVTRFSPFVAQTPVICDRRLQLQDYLKFLLLG